MSERVCECGGELLHGPRGFFCPSCAGLGAPDDGPEAMGGDWPTATHLAVERARRDIEQEHADDDG